MLRPLTMAVPKGRLLESITLLLSRCGIEAEEPLGESRRLVVGDTRGEFRFVLSKPSDVPTYVEYGAADVGIVGKDVLLESEQDVSELVDLGFGRCEIVVAVPDEAPLATVHDLDAHCRVATKYPRIATRFFHRKGLQVEIVPLHGSIELAPLVGLSDAIVDLTETGSTLHANGLRVLETIGVTTARLIANRVSYRLAFERMRTLRKAIEQAVLPVGSGRGRSAT